MTIDYYPTILEIAGAAGDATHNRTIDGVSLATLLRDPQTSMRRPLFWHYPHYHAGGDGPYSAVRDGRYRLIQFHEDKSVRLYDLNSDIGEQVDLSSKLSSKRDELLATLMDWRHSVSAQMPSPNPAHDPAREDEVVRRRR